MIPRPRRPHARRSPASPVRVDRRRFLAGAAAVAGAALSRPAGSASPGAPELTGGNVRAHPPTGALASAHAGTPTPLSDLAVLARDAGGGEPLCLVDLAALDANVATLQRFADVHGWALRPSLAALRSPELSGYVLGLLPEPRGLIPHLREVGPTLDAAPHATDLLLAHAPTADELAGFIAAGPPPGEHRVRITVDDVALLEACIVLVRDAGWDDRLEICLELDSGMGRGGFRDPDEVAAAARRLRDATDAVRCTALRCDDGHAAFTPADAVRRTIARDARARLRELQAVLFDAAGDAIDPDDLVVTGPGSSNYRNWAEGDEIDEIGPGSALVYARYLRAGFDDEELRVALLPAAPVLRRVGASPRVPLTGFTVPGSSREQLLIKGGAWPDASGTLPAMVWPEGLDDDDLHGGRGKHTGAITAPEGALAAGDYVLLWPEQAGDAIDYFGAVTAVREGEVHAQWPTISRWGA